MKTVCIPEDLHKELVNLKLELGDRNTAELIRKLYVEYRKAKFIEASQLFRKKLKESGTDFGEFLKKSRKLREEIADEWF